MIVGIGRRGSIGILAAWIAVTALGCGSDNDAAADAAADAASGVPSNVTTINGQVPPENVVPLADQVQMLRTSDGKGNTMLVARGRRPAHSRAPIHVHQYGGTTCVLEGQMTLYMEGMEPMIATAGTCYYMPPGPVMTGVNPGPTDSILIDYFTFPQEGQPWVVVEPNTTSTSGQFDL